MKFYTLLDEVGFVEPEVEIGSMIIESLSEEVIKESDGSDLRWWKMAKNVDILIKGY